jgi:tRNA threonylcarbamoyl adenosine modification protein (Sua5/YciO/YrdC/YwlC family)
LAQYFQIVPSHPQRRLIVRAAQIVREGGVIAYPTDSCYALGCHIGDKDAMLRLRRIRRFDERHHFSLVCRDLSDVGVYAKVDNAQYRLLRALTPGSYTFILRGTREVPRRLLHPKRKTIGVRLPAHPVAQALLAELGEPLLSTKALLPGDDVPLDGGEQIRERLEHDVDLVLDAGSCGTQPTTIIDLTGAEPLVLRRGRGSLAPLSMEAASLIK